MAGRKTICRQCGLPHPETNPYCFCGPEMTVEEWADKTVTEMFKVANRAAKKVSERNTQ